MSKRKYATEAERLAARRVYDAMRCARDREKRNAHKRALHGAPIRGRYTKLHTADEQQDPRPPLGVILEHAFRCELLAMQGTCAVLMSEPPTSYASAYAASAWRHQVLFARG